MTDKIEVWCVVTEDDVMAVRLVTMTRGPREYGGNAVCDLWEAEGGVRVQCTAETEAAARLLALSEEAGGWVRWVDGVGAVFVPMDEWKEMRP